MDIEFRPIVASEVESFTRCAAAAFGVDPRTEAVAYAQDYLELDRTVAAFEDDRVVGTSGALSWEVTVPVPSPARAAAVTWVSVLPTHRRRGLLTGMMGRL